MGLITPTLPTSGQDRGTEEIDVLNTLTTLVNLANGNLDTANLSGSAGITAAQLATAIVQAAGLNSGGTVRRGKSIVATEESRTNVAYGLMTTPDRVQNIVLPTDGLIAVAYQGMFKNSVASAGRAAIFLGSNQVKIASNVAATPAVAEEPNGISNVDLYRPIYTDGINGLLAVSPTGAVAYTGDVTTGQLLGESGGSSAPGPVYIFAAAGTYDISIQFRSTSGSVTVKNRNLWVWTLGF